MAANTGQSPSFAILNRRDPNSTATQNQPQTDPSRPLAAYLRTVSLSPCPPLYLGPLPSQTLAGPGLRPNFRDLAIQAPPLASLTTPATGIALLDSGNRSNRRAPCVASSLGSPLAPAPTTASLPTGPAAPPPSANAEPATTPAAAEDLLDPRRVPAHTRTGVGAPGDPFLCSRGR